MQDGVRFAVTEEDNQASFKLRYQIYVKSMGRLKDKGDHVNQELRDEYDKSARAVIAIQNGEAIGTLRLFWGGDVPFTDSLIEAYSIAPFLNILKQDQICIVERLMVTEGHRGSNVTLRMYKEVLNFVLKHRAEIVLLDCEPHHLNSYLKLGFRPFTTPYTYPGIGLVIPMALIVGDYEHLKQIGSPFAMLTKPEDLAYCCSAEALSKIIDDKSNVHSLTVSNTSQFLDEIRSLSPGKQWSFDAAASLFDSLTEDEIERLIQKSHIITCKKGNHIIEKDNSAKTMFILLHGHVAVEKGGQMIAMVSPGEVIGEIAFFLGVPRTASIIAATDGVKVLSLDEKGLSRLLKHEGQLANKVLMNLCRGLCSRILAGSETSDFRIN